MPSSLTQLKQNNFSSMPRAQQTRGSALFQASVLTKPSSLSHIPPPSHDRLMDGLKDALEKALPPSALLRTCKRCHTQFNVRTNNPRACRYHLHTFAGETAQRWLPPGQNNGEGRRVVFHWWCCSSEDENAPGCETRAHESYD